jgi:hypothetical protein
MPGRHYLTGVVESRCAAATEIAGAQANIAVHFFHESMSIRDNAE